MQSSCSLTWTSLWRAFSPPPQDWPLAVCDYRSTDDAEDGTPNLLFRVPVLPAPGAQDAPDDEAESAASLFFYNPAHRWWYFPGRVPVSVTLASRCIHAPARRGEGDDDERRGSGTGR